MTEPTNIEKIRQVVQTKKAMQIDGVPLDHISASMIVKAYDKLLPEKQAKFAALSVRKMFATTCKAIG
jgi:hypothetical protein